MMDDRWVWVVQAWVKRKKEGGGIQRRVTERTKTMLVEQRKSRVGEPGNLFRGWS